MKSTLLLQALVITALAPCALAQERLGFPQDRQPPPPQPGFVEQENMRILMRGPVHEAYAQPYLGEPTPGLPVPQLPPPDIQESPPSIRPSEVEEVLWIPGYWGWEDNRFVWVSGTWRDPPPEMRWVPGYWARMGDAVRWVRGLWMRADQEAIAYFPQPPQTRETGAVGEPPDQNHFWVPGVWMFAEGEFRWRDGFWAPAHEEYVWTPAEWYWTPQGYIFRDGYWDYALERRGMLFAPVYPLAEQPQVVTYTPSVIVEPPTALVHFFVRPSYCHYYFGDYYDDVYVQRGFTPWVSYRYYDPLRLYFHYCRPTFFTTVVYRHNFFASNRDWRPPHHYHDYRRYLGSINVRDHDVPGIRFGINVRDIDIRTSNRFVSITRESRERHAHSHEFYARLKENRAKGEFSKGKPSGRETFRLPDDAPDRAPKSRTPPKTGRPPAFGQGDRRLPMPPPSKKTNDNSKPGNKVAPFEPKKGFDRDQPKPIVIPKAPAPKAPAPKDSSKGVDRPKFEPPTTPKKEVDRPKNDTLPPKKMEPKSEEPKKDLERPKIDPPPTPKTFVTPSPPKTSPKPGGIEQPKKETPPTPKTFVPPSPPKTSPKPGGIEQPKKETPPTPKSFVPPAPPKAAPKPGGIEQPKKETPTTPKTFVPPAPPKTSPKPGGIEQPKKETPPTPKSFVPPAPPKASPKPDFDRPRREAPPMEFKRIEPKPPTRVEPRSTPKSVAPKATPRFDPPSKPKADRASFSAPPSVPRVSPSSAARPEARRAHTPTRQPSASSKRERRK